MGTKVIDLTGKKFYRLRVISLAGKDKQRRLLWKCICECGNKSTVRGESLRNGVTRSCGCLQKELAGNLKRSHGMHNTKEYSIWEGMIQRCCNSNSPSYKWYGARGIRIEWNSFEEFFSDMGLCPIGYSIERINNNGNYSKENCKWIPLKNQNKNKRSSGPTPTIIWEYNGKKQSLRDWSKETGVPFRILHSRRLRGWTPERALTTSPRKYVKRVN